jgi:hypothetical protein
MAIRRRTLGGRKLWCGNKRSCQVKEDKIIVDFTIRKGKNLIAAAMKNEIQAGIRAITVPASEASMERRQGMSSSRAVGALAQAFDVSLTKQMKGKNQGDKFRKKRARKHLGVGKWGNDTGILADKLRTKYVEENPTTDAWLLNARKDRLNDDWKGSMARELYKQFREHLLEYVDVLGDPQELWQKPKIQAAVRRVIKSMTTVEKAR